MSAVRATVVLMLLAAVGFGAWRWNGSRSHLRAHVESEPVPTAIARKMDFETILLATGTLEPAGSHPVYLPPIGGELRVKSIIPDGSLVKAGQVIITVDTREREQRLEQTRDDLEQSKEKLDQTSTSGGRRIESARSAVATAEQRLELTKAQIAADLKRAQAELDRAKDEREYAREQLAKMQRLADEGLATREQLDQERTNDEEQSFAYEKAERALANAQREAAEKARSAAMELDKSKLDLGDAETGNQRAVEAAQDGIESLERQVAQQEREIAETTVRCDRDGMLLHGQIYDRDADAFRLPRVGSLVGGGTRMGEVTDPKRVRVTCEIDEIDMRRVRAGQRVRLRIGTARGQVFAGHLETVNTVATEITWWRGGNPGRKSFSAVVLVDRAVPAMKPGVTAWLDIRVGAAKGKLVVPLQAIFQESGKAVVFRRRASRFERVPVKLGPRNEFCCAVLAGLKPGDEIALTRPSPDTVGAGLPTGPRAGTEPRPYDGPRTRRRT